MLIIVNRSYKKMYFFCQAFNIINTTNYVTLTHHIHFSQIAAIITHLLRRIFIVVPFAIAVAIHLGEWPTKNRVKNKDYFSEKLIECLRKFILIDIRFV